MPKNSGKRRTRISYKATDVPGLYDLQCNDMSCNKSYSDCCLRCDSGYCRGCLRTHECNPTPSSSAVSQDWTTATVAPTRKKMSYTQAQREIVRYTIIKYCNKHAAQAYNLGTSLVYHWGKMSSKYAIDARAAASRPLNTVPARPLADVFTLKLEERNDDENKAVW